jgi:Zn-dependent alcohol dehydrogenase
MLYRAFRARADDLSIYRLGGTTGDGPVFNMAKVQPGDSPIIFGLGGIGLNVLQGARMPGARKWSASKSI